jgi:predicted glycoside hydrolase/deacetylase ChbG (UPF0249 family)
LKQLIVNADDFGFTHDVNLGIVEAHNRGVLTAATLMANGYAFDHAVHLAREHSELDVGCHLVLVGGSSVARTGDPLPSTLNGLLQAICLRRVRPYEELRAQVNRILDAGVRPRHLDTHKHTHLFPPVLDAVARLSEEFRIPWVRRPFDLPLSSGPAPLLKRTIGHSVQSLRRRFHAKLTRHGCRTTDHFAGFQLTGYLRTPELIDLLRRLPDGLTEFMCHPGHCTDELRSAHTRLKESREEELKALMAPEVRATVEELGIRLVRYRDLV